MPIKRRLLTIANNIPEICKKLFTKKTVSGSTVFVSDVNSNEHNLEVRVKSKNILPYPYEHTTRTHNGITFTDNGDGTITAKGTATGNAEFYLVNCSKVVHQIPECKDKSFITIGGCPGGASSNTYYLYNLYTGHKTINGEHIVGKTQSSFRYKIVIVSGTTVDNIVFKPQIEFVNHTNEDTKYTPYTTEFNNISVSRLGKNLFDINQSNATPYKHYGMATEIVDDVVHIYGVSTISNLVSFSFITNNQAYLRGKGYSFSLFAVSGVPEGARLYGLRTDSEANIAIQMKLTTDNEYDMYFKIMVTAKSTVGEYEPYKELQTAISDAEGVVRGLTSLSPNITLIADNNDINIQCSYRYGDNKINSDKFIKLKNSFENAKGTLGKL